MVIVNLFPNDSKDPTEKLSKSQDDYLFFVLQNLAPSKIWRSVPLEHMSHSIPSKDVSDTRFYLINMTYQYQVLNHVSNAPIGDYENSCQWSRHSDAVSVLFGVHFRLHVLSGFCVAFDGCCVRRFVSILVGSTSRDQLLREGNTQIIVDHSGRHYVLELVGRVQLLFCFVFKCIS